MRRATVLYDEDCGFCRWSADRLRAWDRHRNLRFVPLQGSEADRLLHSVPESRRASSWHLVESNGRVWSAGAGVPRVMQTLPGGLPFAMLASSFPGLTDRVYAVVARHRTTIGHLLGPQACSADPSKPSRRNHTQGIEG